MALVDHQGTLFFNWWSSRFSLPDSGGGGSNLLWCLIAMPIGGNQAGERNSETREHHSLNWCQIVDSQCHCYSMAVLV